MTGTASPKRWLKEPLLQFLVGGLLLFALDSVLFPARDDARTIIVDDEALLTYMQAQDKAFAADTARAKLQALSEGERASLEARYLEEEILYREALALGLDRHDFILKSRLIQKMDYLILDTQAGQLEISEAKLKAWFRENIESYRVEETVTFTHLFWGQEGRTREQAAALAEKALVSLTGRQNTTETISSLGERFYFHRDYAERPAAFIDSHFGEEFRTAIFAADQGKWVGPLMSAYGAHLVFVRAKSASRLPELSEVAAIVLADYEQHQRTQIRRQAVEGLKAQYRIVK